MKIVIIGADGQLGHDLCRVIDRSEQIPLTIKDIDITDAQKCETVLLKYSPEIVINTAAYNKVDEAERSRAAAYLVNADGAKNVAMVCKKLGALMVHFSTDYVFDGSKNEPYVEDDEPNPRTIYGQSKREGEKLIGGVFDNYFIIRTSSLFGKAGCMGKGGTNFVETIISKAKNEKNIPVVEEKMSPTYTLDLANRILEMIKDRARPNIYHVVNSGECTWFKFAQKIVEIMNLDAIISPVKPGDWVSQAHRPKYSVLGSKHMPLLRNWEEALRDYLAER